MSDKISIIIPYRDREDDLEYYLENSVGLFSENYNFIIVEQSSDNRLFNRGALINIGVIESKNSDFIIISLKISFISELINI